MFGSFGMEKGLGWLAVILFLVLMVAGEGAWTTKEQAWGSKMENMREGGRRNRIEREVNRLYDCRWADYGDLFFFFFHNHLNACLALSYVY